MTSCGVKVPQGLFFSNILANLSEKELPPTPLFQSAQGLCEGRSLSSPLDSFFEE